MNHLFPTEDQQLLCEVGGSGTGHPNLVYFRPKRVSLIQFLENHVTISVDHCKQVVEVMGYAARQPSNALQFLGLQILLLRLSQCFFGQFPLGNIALAPLHSNLAAGLIQNRRPGCRHPFHPPVFCDQPEFFVLYGTPSE